MSTVLFLLQVMIMLAMSTIVAAETEENKNRKENEITETSSFLQEFEIEFTE